MSDFLIQFLMSRITPELMNLYLRAGDLISYFERDDIYDILDDYLMNVENTDTHNTLNKVYQIHTDILTNIIGEFGIGLSEDISLEDLINILEAVIYLEDYEDKETIFNIISVDEDNVVKLTDCLDVVSIKDNIYFQEFITKVNPNLISKLYTHCLKEIKTEVNEDTDTKKIKEISKKLKELKDNPTYNKSLVFDLIKNGLNLNLPITLYLSLFKDTLFSDELTQEQIAVNMSILGLISSDTDYIKELTDTLPKYVLDLTEVSTILSNTRRYYIGV